MRQATISTIRSSSSRRSQKLFPLRWSSSSTQTHVLHLCLSGYARSLAFAMPQLAQYKIFISGKRSKKEGVKPLRDKEAKGGDRYRDSCLERSRGVANGLPRLPRSHQSNILWTPTPAPPKKNILLIEQIPFDLLELYGLI